MNIYGVSNTDYNISMQGKYIDAIKRTAKKIYDKAVPEYTLKESENQIKSYEKINHVLSSPVWNKVIVGGTGAVIQPTIDYYNHRVDEETRTVSRNRTFAKIVAGSLVGIFVVRGPVYKMVEKMTDLKGKSKYSKALIPKQWVEDLLKNPHKVDRWRCGLSMLLALGAMCFTNILLDAPLTNLFTNYLNKKSGIKESPLEKKEAANG